ncbi:MAG: hypothetical protein WCP21_15380, partial [Armatimonadota bacterium]
MFRKLTMALLALAVCLPVIAQPAVWRWDKDGDLAGWTGVNFQSLDVKGGMLRGVTKWDPILISPEVSIDASRYKIIEFRAQSSITSTGEIFWHGAGGVFTEKLMSRHSVIASDAPRVYQVDMSAYPGWEGIVTGLRLDLINAAGATVAIDYVRLVDRLTGVVPNASFENDFDGNGVPDGWTAQAAEFKLSEEQATEGTRSALVGTGAKGTATLSTRVPLDNLGQYHLDADLKLEGAAKRVYATLAYLDVFGKPLPDRPALLEAHEPGPKTRLSGDFDAPRNAAAAELALTIEGAGVRGWWDVVDLKHTYETPDLSSAPFETWRASWIWAEATLNKENAPAYLRKSFDLPVAAEQVSMAKVQVTVDDAYTLFVNGKQVAEAGGAEGWRTPEMLDLKPYLVQGRNVIGILAKNIGSSSGA